MGSIEKFADLVKYESRRNYSRLKCCSKPIHSLVLAQTERRSYVLDAIEGKGENRA